MVMAAAFICLSGNQQVDFVWAHCAITHTFTLW